jgi:hypothetical protein
MQQRFVLLAALISVTLSQSLYAIDEINQRTGLSSGESYVGLPLFVATKPATSFHTFKGTLKDNLDQIASQAGWQTKWQSKKFYHVLLETDIAGDSLAGVVDQLLQHYPLQASFDGQNHIITISDKAAPPLLKK